MAAYPVPPSPSYPPIGPCGIIDQTPTGGYPAKVPQSPTFPSGPSASAIPYPQPPYAPSPYGNHEQAPAANMPQVPYPAGPYESSNTKPAENCPSPQFPSPPGFRERIGPVSPANTPPHHPYPFDPNQSNYQTPEGAYPTPGFQLPSDITGSIIAQNASAPPLDSIEKVPGYEHVTFDSAILTPPVASEWPERPVDREHMAYLHKFSKEEVQDDIFQYASEHCCYGEKAAQEMEIGDSVMSSVYHYTLETFGEKRESAWCFEPYKGQIIDGPANGPAPGPWEVVAKPKEYYKNSQIKMEVPHTACVKPCHGCAGNGYVLCDTCTGSGMRRCNSCNGKGRTSDGPCLTCHSSGQKRCVKCNGNGKVKCKICDGHAEVKGFVELTVTWINHFDDYISDTSVMPKEKIRKVSGEVIFREEMPRVWPITHCAEHHVNKASSDLVQKHNTSYQEERILVQRHSLQIVPIGKCSYSWKNKTGDFCVYGFEQKVYFPNYPQNCCCCCHCNIL